MLYPVFISYFPSGGDSYVSMAVLGEGLETRAYFPRDNSSINPNSNMSWYIYIHNNREA